MWLKVAVRDITIVLLGVIGWHYTAQWSAQDTMRGDLSGVVVGLLVGVGGYFLHEWGHLAGAWLTGSHVEPPATLKSGFLFSFDSQDNNLRQFLIMSFSGFAATALVVWAFYTWLPDGLLATRVARGVALIGAFLTVFVEIPLVLYAVISRRLPPVENGGHTVRKESQNQAVTEDPAAI